MTIGAMMLNRQPAPAVETDVVEEVRTVLRRSPEPLTLPRIRAALPPALRSIALPTLDDILQRQAALQVVHAFPRYRSPHPRFWDRPMAVHLECLLRDLLRDGPLPWSEMRRSLPDYAKTQAEEVLHTLVQQGALFRHPPVNRRMGTRFALSPANPLPAARAELRTLLDRLHSLGYDRAQVRESLLEALREEEWAEAHQHPTLPAPVPEQALLDTVVEFRMPVGSP